jgi:hypothetical protein
MKKRQSGDQVSSLCPRTSGNLPSACFCAATIAKKTIVENHRIASDKTVQRTVLYLGEINDQQQAAWRKTLSVFDEQQQEYENLSLFPDDREIPRLLLHAPGLTPTAVLEKLAEIKMIDVWIPTVDQRWLILPRYTQPSVDTKLLVEKLKLQLPSQPPPRLVAQKQSYEIKVPTVR